MKSLTRLFVAFGLTALLASPASAQFGRGMMGGMGGPNVQMLTIPEVQKELKLDDSQVEKATAFATEMREKMQASFQELQNLEGEERAKKQQELGKERTEANKKFLAGLLKPEQSKRFHELTLRQQGVMALGSPDVQKDLKVTDAQKEKITAIMTEMGSSMRELFQSSGGDREAMREKMTALRKETEEKLNKELTDDQKKSWKELLGAPFEFPPPRPRNN